MKIEWVTWDSMWDRKMKNGKVRKQALSKCEVCGHERSPDAGWCRHQAGIWDSVKDDGTRWENFCFSMGWDCPKVGW